LIVIVVIVAGSVIITTRRKIVMSTVDVFSLIFLRQYKYSNSYVTPT
jgi:hypothetical protein